MGRGEEVKVGIGEVGIEELVKRGRSKSRDRRSRDRGAWEEGRSKSRDRRSRDRGAWEEGKK